MAKNDFWNDFSPVPRAKRNIKENNSIRYFNFFNPLSTDHFCKSNENPLSNFVVKLDSNEKII